MGTKNPADLAKIELGPDGEQRFLAAIHAAAKSGPKHRTPPPPKPSVGVKKARKR